MPNNNGQDFSCSVLEDRIITKCRGDNQLIAVPRFDQYSEKRAKSLSREQINRKRQHGGELFVCLC